MKRLLALVVFLPSLLLSADLDTLRSSIFKIKSKGPSIARELIGSGVLFKKDGSYFILTSDHVVVHSNEYGNLHTAYNSHTGEEYSLKYLASEWGLGLCLLELKVTHLLIPKKSLTYEELIKPASLSVGDTTSFFGYPFDSEDLTEETEAKTLNTSASVPYFVNAPELIEFEALIGEFGMSGGGAFTAGGDFLGILAYQNIVGGQQSEFQNHVYALPQKKVTDWLSYYFQSGDKYIPTFSEPYWAQGQSDQILFTNNGHVFMFRLIEGVVRMAFARMESLIILSDIPTLLWNDNRGILSAFRKDMENHKLQPAEFSIIDRNGDEPKILSLHYPAEVMRLLNEKGISVFVARGEKHEWRYSRYKPLVERLAKEVAPIKTPALSKELNAFLTRLNTVPPKPKDPGAGGASEFFNAYWIADTFFIMKRLIDSEGWELAKKEASNEMDQIQRTFTDLKDALNSFEIVGAD